MVRPTPLAAPLITALTLLFAYDAAGQATSPRRSIPVAMRDALVGCWDLGAGETYAIEPYGAHGLVGRWEATGRAGARERHRGTMYFLEDASAVTGGCGAVSQHG